MARTYRYSADHGTATKRRPSRATQSHRTLNMFIGDEGDALAMSPKNIFRANRKAISVNDEYEYADDGWN